MTAAALGSGFLHLPGRCQASRYGEGFQLKFNESSGEKQSLLSARSSKVHQHIPGDFPRLFGVYKPPSSLVSNLGDRVAVLINILYFDHTSFRLILTTYR